ncbi:MAG: hypothetical protein Q9226_006783 [Calogaya cf. arnoldii]
MGMFTRPPFVLFALEDIPIKTLNTLLQKAKDGSTVEQWWWYLAEVPDYRAAPQERPDYSHDLGTEAPIKPSFSSHFVGKRLEDLTQWLINKPPNVFLDAGFFGVLDKQTERTGKIAICRVNDPKEPERAWCIQKTAAESTLYMAGLDSIADWNMDVQDHKYEIDI